jgi:hypothetical protein
VDKFIFAACAVTAMLSAWLLLRAYHRGGPRLLLWSGLCFSGLTLNNLLLVLDKTVYASADLSVPRLVVALVSLCLLVGGMVMEGGR